MTRNQFLKTAAAAGAAGAVPSAAQPPARVRFKAGTQHIGATTPESDNALRLMAAIGVNHICSREPSMTPGPAWSVDSLKRLREHVESFGLHLDMVPLPLSSVPIAQSPYKATLLGKSPERDREIDALCDMIRNVGRAGIPAAKYNFTVLGFIRSPSTPGRGGATYSTLKLAAAKEDPPLTEAGIMDAERKWETITYFLRRVVPVANEYKVKLALHPFDGPIPPPHRWRGVTEVLGTVEGLKRFITIEESPYHGLNFCQGTVSEMLREPSKEIYDVIRYFGSRKKIFNVHFRNIRGGLGNFQETYIDEGDVDMLKALRVYKEVGYDGMLMPDHVPSLAADPGGAQQFAYTLGYIRALIRAVDDEGSASA
ncbi:MAG: mannonate dehydratase [Bryobacterales bacterium]|nr:mannonate dehydratase [Bryobacterales bacterium]